MTFAGFKYPKRIYKLPSPNTVAGLKKKREMRKVCGQYYKQYPLPIEGPHPGGMFYLDSDFQPGRYILRADAIIALNHFGWYCDEYGDRTIHGIVIVLPHGRYLSGWSMGSSMASSYDGKIYTDLQQAAYAADEDARITAEIEREFQSCGYDDEDEEN